MEKIMKSPSKGGIMALYRMNYLGILRYSPIFYGYYNNGGKNKKVDFILLN